MANLRLSVAAERDLEQIQEEGEALFGDAVADAHSDRFERIFALLRNQPLAGQERPDYARSIRTLSNRPHIVLYQVQGDTVLVVRVLHGSRDIRRALRQRS